MSEMILPALVSAIVSAIVTAILTVFWQKIRRFLTYEIYRKFKVYLTVYIGKEGKLFDSYAQSILYQESSPFIDIPVDIKKTLTTDFSNNKDAATILAVIDTYEKCVVLGLGGRGKSALVRKVEQIYADNYLAYQEKKYLPFSLSSKNICRKGLIEAIEQRCEEKGVPIPSGSIEKYSTHQSLMLLIDGVEILSETEREILSQKLKKYIDSSTKFPPRIVLTVASERSDNVLKNMEITNEMSVIELQEFEDRHVEEYVRNGSIPKK
ncbi:MAG: NACHT domain-containing protein [Candidatus Electrothrix sp. MAN1_4]|nr:NACHT domain-containing protein [Candidatus Electrothrix sp. MAN1_4]